jgi:solute carrier family 39 (zinc transporter), member 1/2/3
MHTSLPQLEVKMASETRAALVFCLLYSCCTLALAQAEPLAAEGSTTCAGPAAVGGKCHNVPKALRLKLIAIPTILVASMVGVCLPLFSRSVPALRPDGNLFVIVKAFASGVILGTGYMHVLPDSFHDLSSPCLPQRPWAQFPFTAFVAMLAALCTLMVDSLMLTFHNRRSGGAAVAHHSHDACCNVVEATLPDDDVEATSKKQLLRNRVIVQVTACMRVAGRTNAKISCHQTRIEKNGRTSD